MENHKRFSIFFVFLFKKETMATTINNLSDLDITNGVYSYADYITWKFDQTVELIKGKILQMSAPSRRHQGISWKMTLLIGNHFAKHPCRAYAAPFDVRLYNSRKSDKVNKDVYSVVQPDICIICDLDKFVIFPDLKIDLNEVFSNL